jgi:hypothetical protein
MGKNLTMRDCSAFDRLYRPKSLPFVVFEVKISGTYAEPCGTEAAACGKRAFHMRFHAVLCGSLRFFTVLYGTHALQIPLKNGSSGTPLGDFC